jgi:hypothetical protein
MGIVVKLTNPRECHASELYQDIGGTHAEYSSG